MLSKAAPIPVFRSELLENTVRPGFLIARWTNVFEAAPLIDRPPPKVEVPVPLIVPPVHVAGPLTLCAPVPLRVPELRRSDEADEAALNVAVPPETSSAPAFVTVALQVAEDCTHVSPLTS
jgi:hypothetical protein